MSCPPVFFFCRNLQNTDFRSRFSVHTRLMKRNFPEMVYFWPFQLVVSEGHIFFKIFFMCTRKKSYFFCPHRVSEKNFSIFLQIHVTAAVFSSRRISEKKK